jgi:iron complex outermembrane recepter protein
LTERKENNTPERAFKNGIAKEYRGVEMALQTTDHNLQHGNGGVCASVCSFIMATGFVLAQAQAQTAPVAGQDAQGSTGQLAEIVVTAQKRREDVQKVPIAISAFDSKALAAKGVGDPQALQYAVPGLVYSASSTGVGLVTLRGIGGSALRGSTPGQNPAVPVMINGVYLQSPSIMLQDFMDVQRVEVLRGPQGTLYGRNAVGGSINIITEKPTDVFQGEAGLELGNFNLRRGYGIVSGPIADSLRGRLAISVEQHGPWVNDVANPADDQLQSSHSYNIRGTLEYDVASYMKATVVGYDYRNTGSNFVMRNTSLPGYQASNPLNIYNYLPPGYDYVTSQDDRKVAHDTPGYGLDETRGVTSDMAVDGRNIVVRSITGYFDMTTTTQYDADGTDVPALRTWAYFTSKYRTFSEELQVASKDVERVRWVVGGYYYNERSSYQGALNGLQSAVPFLVDFTDPAQVHSQSFSVFGQADYHLTDALTLTAGSRYNYDRMAVVRSLAFSLFGETVSAFSRVPASASWQKPTWKLGLNYQIDPTVMVYASYSRGYKSGGFNVQDNNPPFAPESLDDYEGGLKTQLFDRHLQLNGALYYYDYSDIQEATADAVGFTVIENAAKATAKGVELEGIAKVFHGLRLDGSIEYEDARFNAFSTADPDNLAAGVQNLSGKYLPDAPKCQVDVGVQYTLALSHVGQITARVDNAYSSTKYARPFNLETDKLPSYNRTNLQLMWDDPSFRWKVTAYVENLQNRDVLSNFADTSPLLGYIHLSAYLPPRTFGVRLSSRF